MADHRKKLKAICIIAIVLGGLGFLSIVSEISGAALRSSFQGRIPAGAPEKLRQIQEELEAELLDLAIQWRGYHITLLIGGVLVSAGLIAGGIQILRNRKTGLSILMMALLLAIPMDLMRNSFSLYMRHQASLIGVRFMERMMQLDVGSGHQAPDEVLDFVSGAVTAMHGVYSIFLIVWTLLKMYFYVISFRYLQKPGIDNLFTPPKPPPLPAQL